MTTSELPDASADESGAALRYDHLAAWFWPTAVLAIAWWAILGTMAVRTANPVTLSFEQLGQSLVVVEATVLDAESGRVRIDRRWPDRDDLPTGEIVVSNLSETGARSGETYVLPLSPRGTAWQVTTPKLPGLEKNDRGDVVARRGPPTIYPANDDSRGQLERMLNPAAAE